MFGDKHQFIGFLLTSLSIGEIIFACLLTSIVLVLIMFHLFYNRIEQDDRVILILSINIYLSCLIYMLLFFIFLLRSALGDIYHIEFDTIGCAFIGYIYAVSLCVLYLSFTNQAFFRLCRIVYPQYKCLQTSNLYILIVPIQAIFASILLLPIYIWNDIVYLPNDHFCFVPISNVRGYLWIFLSVYGIPVVSLLLIYIRITIYIRQQSNQPIRIKRRQKRDLNAIRGIFLLVGFLLFLGIPTLILMIIMFITGDEHPLTFRVTCLSIGTSMVGLSVAMITSIPQLKTIVWKGSQSA
ncbi:unnamed protein product [Adineta ricciae]|uniref:G-protein coupled receptors family 1 profile domain-containing protein n=1 Tax=Adineta ricciae TaxID=249248 RepID=A0A816D4U6_ADIRI|nr:unnamed protein product [Adineta ricciae]CAF1630323.1 unnamed protein product [Adineta ricciae]